MDHFMEEVVVRRKRALYELLYYLANAAMVLFGIIGVWMLTNLMSAFSLAAVAFTLLFGGIAVLLYLYRDRLRVEYALHQSFPLDVELFFETIGGVFGKAKKMADEKHKQGAKEPQK